MSEFFLSSSLEKSEFCKGEAGMLARVQQSSAQPSPAWQPLLSLVFPLTILLALGMLG